MLHSGVNKYLLPATEVINIGTRPRLDGTEQMFNADKRIGAQGQSLKKLQAQACQGGKHTDSQTCQGGKHTNMSTGVAVRLPDNFALIPSTYLISSPVKINSTVQSL